VSTTLFEIEKMKNENATRDASALEYDECLVFFN